ncbi:MAG TPA: hypothetical protein VLW44_07365 [Streptosporangiaceae bacterium]|nr:hypothetical protein [Streptosporangiaceae bacterium]
MTVVIWVVTALAAAVMLAAGYAVGGQAGLLAVVALAATVALLAARLRIPAPPASPPRPPASRQEQQQAGAEFAAYRHIEAALGQAQVSPRHFGHTARPLLQRLLAALLADRRRVDMASDPGAAREAIGDELWPLLDPARPASEDSRQPGVSEQTIARIVDRLEDL